MKTFFKKIFAPALAGLCTMTAGNALVSCTPETDEEVQYTITLDKGADDEPEAIFKGQTLVITPTFEGGSNAATRKYTWKSTDPNVVKIVEVTDNVVTVQGMNPGSATIRISLDSDPTVMATCRVQVSTYEIALTPNGGVLRKNGTMVITPSFSNQGAGQLEYEWSSDKPEIASVVQNADGTATVTGKGDGQAKITMTCKTDKYLTVSCGVIVETWSVALDKSNEELALAGELTPTPTFTPEDAAGIDYTWSAAPAGRVTLTENADGSVKVTGAAAGEAVVSITADIDPTITASCTINVRDLIVTLDKTVETMERVGSAIITPTFSPAAASHTYTWTATPSGVVTLVENQDRSVTVFGVTTGKATVTITSNTNANLTASCEVTVTASTVTLDKTTESIEGFGSKTITPTFTPAAGALQYTWTATPEGIVSLVKNADNSVTVTGEKAGTVAVTITCDTDPTLTASCQVTVTPVAFAFDAIHIDGSAVAGGKTAIAATLENTDIYAWYGDLAAGELTIPVELGGNSYYAIPTDGSTAFAATTEEAVKPATLTKGAAKWTIAAAGKYRVVINKTTKTLAVYSPTIDLQPFVATWMAGTEERNTVVTTFWMYGDGTGWGWRAGGFTPSAADPQILVYQGQALNNGNGVKFVVYGESDFRNNAYAFTNPLTEGGTRQSITPEQAGYKLHGGYDGETRNSYYKIPGGTNFMVLDLRNLTIQVETR